MGEGPGRDTRRRLSVHEAATALGVTVDAVRSRVKRGTIAHEREGGRVYVLLGADQEQPGHDQGSAQHTEATTPGEDRTAELIATLREQLEAEREANRENRRIIAALTSRIPELPPAAAGSSTEARPSPEQATSSPAGPVAPDARAGMVDEERRFWRQVRRAGRLSFIIVLWVLSIGGVGLIPVLVPSFPTSQVRSGWGNAWLAVFLVPIVFGSCYGTFRVRWAHRSSGPPGQTPPFEQLVSAALATGVGAAIASLTAIGFTYNADLGSVSLGILLLYEVVPALGLLLATTFFVLSTMLIGVARSRKREGQGGVAASPAPGGARPASWSPRQQAIIGLVGTTITALFTFFGVVIQVLAGKGGG